MCFVKICQQCGKEFTTKRYPTQFCSPRCYSQHKRTELNKRKLQLIKQYDSHIDVLLEDGKLRYIKQCDHCGNEFKAPRANGRFCCRKTEIWDQTYELFYEFTKGRCSFFEVDAEKCMRFYIYDPGTERHQKSFFS